MIDNGKFPWHTSAVASKRSRQVMVRLKEHEYRAWNRAAKQADLTLSEWIRQLVTASPTMSVADDPAPTSQQKSTP
jgi:hypothetical protein